MKVNSSSVFLVSVLPFAGSNENPARADRNGKLPVYLNTISGDALPQQARVLSGSVAENQGLNVGISAAISVTRLEDHPEYGEQYRHVLVQKSNGLTDTLSAAQMMGGINISQSASAEPITADAGTPNFDEVTATEGS